MSDAGAGGAGDDGQVPRSALLREREKRQEADARNAELEARLKALEDGGKSEVAQAIGRAERAEAKISEVTQKLEQNEAKLKATERSQLLRDALLAHEEKKIRPDALTAAVRLADLDAVEDEKTAKAAAKTLLETHAFLVAEAGPPPRMGSAGAGRQGQGAAGEDGGRNGKPMVGEDGKPTEEYKRGLGQFLLGVAGRGQQQEGQPTT